jgi:ribosomal protein S18 acetylase RimI-like enzyme
MTQWMTDDNDCINCDFTNPQHCGELCNLINEYISDDMGGGSSLEGMKKIRLLDGLESHPRSIVFFVLHKGNIAGVLVGFINFSTFMAKPMINIHDVFVRPVYRGKGLGRKLLHKVIEIAEQHACGKITLEVRNDNVKAQTLYQSEGFGETAPGMWFWTKKIK